jgi:MYXO-CTERM domain-containing protein
MRNTTLTIMFACSVGLVSVTGAHADLITFTHTGSGSGTLNSSMFGPSNFTIVSTADTNNRESHSSGYYIEHDSATIMIDGLGTYDITDATRTFVNYNHQIVGFSRGNDGTDLFNGPSDPAFLVWEMLTSVGPVTGTGDLLQWGTGINTSGGILYFYNGSSSATFTATIPAPGVMALLGVAGFVGRRRRR